ncbi:MAG: hypothetical protein HY423_14650 [Candidatus Lambdaproteobacteria bacterium]|nr:hypothetical protein [Candidatus Lambdaproteobacteria bacterium]
MSLLEDRYTLLTLRPASASPLPVLLTHSPHEWLLTRHQAELGALMAAAMALLGFLAPVMLWGAAAVAALLPVRLLIARRRLRARYRADGAGILREGGATLPWAQLSSLRLRFHPHRRGLPHGEFVLRLGRTGAALLLDSTMAAFPVVLARAAEEARGRDLPLDAATIINLRVLGLWGRE